MLQKIGRNFTCFLPPVFLFLGGGALPEVLDVHYKIEPDSDDVAKFRGDRPRVLGDWSLNKKTSRVKHKRVRNGGSGRPNKLKMSFKVIKSGTNRKLVYDFLLVLCSNFCRITHRLREI